MNAVPTVGQPPGQDRGALNLFWVYFANVDPDTEIGKNGKGLISITMRD